MAGLLSLLALLFWGASACRIKREVKIAVSPKVLAARTATLDELVAVVNQYEKITDLKSSGLKVFMTAGKWESGRQEEYRDAPGYILLRQPSALHLVLQNPVIYKTAIFEAVSSGDHFSAWLRNTNKVYEGRNSARKLFADDLPDGISLRPSHIYAAIIPPPIDPRAPGLRISVEEAADKTAKYYILSVYREGAPPVIHTLRRIWIERSALVLDRVQTFDDDGSLSGETVYTDMRPVSGFPLPHKIDLSRPEDGYALALEFAPGSWTVNSGLGDDSFVLPQRAGAEVIELREK